MSEAVCLCPGEAAVAAGLAEAVELAGRRLRQRVQRPEAARHVVDYLRGLLADVARKNGWQLAEYAGYAHPRGIQRVLARYVWDVDAVRDDLRDAVMTALGDPAGILVIDETGFPKQGTHSVGVARQYCGTLGKIANCQIGVFLGYASPRGHAAIDRALYLPRAWLEAPDRCRQAGIPPDTPFRTKPQLAETMLARALEAGVPAAWVAGDEIYGSDGSLRRALERRDQAYVLAVRGNEAVTTWPPYGAPEQSTTAVLGERLAPDTWQRLSCGEGAQGPRVYEWACRPLRPALTAGWVHVLLVRRHPVRREERAYYLVYAPVGTALVEMVRVAGARWTIEEVFKLAKGQVGLDQYEVRSWQGWYRHITLALLALALLVSAAAPKGGAVAPSISPSPCPNCGASSSGSSGPRPTCRPPSSLGRAGVATISALPRSATASAV